MLRIYVSAHSSCLSLCVYMFACVSLRFVHCQSCILAAINSGSVQRSTIGSMSHGTTSAVEAPFSSDQIRSIGRRFDLFDQFCSLGVAAAYRPTPATIRVVTALLGDLCTDDKDCTIPNSECSNGGCICSEGYAETSDRQECFGNCFDFVRSFKVLPLVRSCFFL